MNDTLTVGELISYLNKFDATMPVNISGVGVSARDSWNAPLDLEELTVDQFDGIVRINFSLY